MAVELEPVIDRFESELEPITFFILPGGSVEASLLHQARGVARRAESAVVLLSRDQPINPAVIIYLNRLSDMIFVARAARQQEARRGGCRLAEIVGQQLQKILTLKCQKSAAACHRSWARFTTC